MPPDSVAEAGMWVELSEAPKAARRQFRDFVAAEITPRAASWDREERISSAVIDALRDRGYLAAPLAHDAGDRGMDAVTYGLLTEEIARGCSSGSFWPSAAPLTEGLAQVSEDQGQEPVTGALIAAAPGDEEPGDLTRLGRPVGCKSPWHECRLYSPVPGEPRTGPPRATHHERHHHQDRQGPRLGPRRHPVDGHPPRG